MTNIKKLLTSEKVPYLMIKVGINKKTGDKYTTEDHSNYTVEQIETAKESNNARKREFTHYSFYLKHSNVYCLDFDEVLPSYDDIPEKLRGLVEKYEMPHTRSTRGKFHFYFKADDVPSQYEGVDVFKDFLGDFIHEQRNTWEVRNAKVYGYDKVPYVDFEELIPLFKSEEERKKEKKGKKEKKVKKEKKGKKEVKNVSDDSDDEDLGTDEDYENLKKILEALDDSRAHSYDEWLAVMFAIHNIMGESEKRDELAHLFSAKASNYDSDGVDKTLRSFKNRDGYRWRYLYGLLEDDDEELYEEWKGKITYEMVKKEFEQVYFKVKNPFGYVKIYKNYITNDWDITLMKEKQLFECTRDVFFFKKLESKNKELLKLKCRLKKEERNKKRIVKEIEREERKIAKARLEEKLDKIELRINDIKDEINEENEENGGEYIRVDFVPVWIKDMKIRQYDSFDFYPDIDKCPPDVYNLFSGFEIEKLQYSDEEYTNMTDEERDGLEIILNHMRNLTGNNEESYIYLLKYVAHMFQFPMTLERVGLIFRSDEGAGKGLFYQLLSSMLSKKYTYDTAEPKFIFGEHSINCRGKILINYNEGNGSKTFSMNEAIKERITEPIIRTRQLYFEDMPSRNLGRYLVFTNARCAILIGPSDRRWVVYDCNNDICSDESYFTPLRAAIDNEKIRWLFYKYLMSLDVKDFNFETNRPKTEGYMDMKQGKPILRFLLSIIEDKDIVDQYISSNVLLEKYNEFLEKEGMETVNSRTFGLDMGRITFLKKKRAKSTTYYKIISKEGIKHFKDYDLWVDDDDEESDDE